MDQKEKELLEAFCQNEEIQNFLNQTYFCEGFSSSLKVLRPAWDDKNELDLNNILVRGAYYGDTGIVSCCLKNGASPCETDETGRNALHAAATSGHLNCVKLLVEKDSELVNVADFGEWTPLLIAVCKNYVDVAEYLLEHKADLKHEIGHVSFPCIETSSYSSAIHFAVMRNNKHLVDVLLKHGATISTKDQANRVPLHYAISRCEVDLLRYFISLGTNSANSLKETDPSTVNVKDIHKRTPIYSAIRNNNIEALKLLLEFNADARILDIWDISPNKLASYLGLKDLAKLLPFIPVQKVNNSFLKKLSTTLEEPDIEQLRRCIIVLGEEKCASYLEETLDIIRQGGQKISHSDKLKKPGGIFFKLIRRDTLEEKIPREHLTYTRALVSEFIRFNKHKNVPKSSLTFQ